MNSNLAKRINEAAQHYGYKGPLDPGMVHLIEEEGFVPTEYEDDVGVSTEGVGATAENKGKNFFTEIFPKYEERAARKVKGYTTMPQDLKNAVLSAVYRGDLGPKTAKLLSKGQYAAAAEEYLDHAEYKKRKAKNPDDGVVKRMERNAAVMRKYAEEQPA
jgi:GH24 family phage-related lysozyme (muramidase)